MSDVPKQLADRPIDAMWRYIQSRQTSLEISRDLRLKEIQERPDDKTDNLEKVIASLNGEIAMCERLCKLLNRISECRDEIEPILRRRYGGR